jgi:membrane-bound hydrogenase subunit beta
MKIDRNIIKDFVKHLQNFEKYPHFAVSSGYDMGDTIDLVYHFSIGYGERGRDISINVIMSLPKSDPTIDTITDLIPGALISEQEKQEMLGVIVKGIPKNERVFIAKEFPEGVYPWRKDEKGPEKYIKNLHEVKK